MNQVHKSKPKRLERTELSPKNIEKGIKPVEVFQMYKEAYPDTMVKERVFVHFILIYFKEFVKQLLLGEMIKVFGGFSFQIFRRKNHLRPKIDNTRSSQYKAKLWGCSDCEAYTKMKAGKCHEDNMMTVMKCPKDISSVEFKSKQYPNGKEWIFIIKPKYYSLPIMVKRNARSVKNKKIYDFAPRKSLLTMVKSIEDNSIFEIK